MVDYYLDERTAEFQAEQRAERRSANEREYLPNLITTINECTRDGVGYHAAIAHWIASIQFRIPTGLRTLKIPHVLREVLGLTSQDVILEKGCLWSAVNGVKDTLLYSPNS